MATVNLELNAHSGFSKEPVLWRLGKLYNVVTLVRRARVSEDYAYLSLELEGSTPEIDMATNYLKEIGWLSGTEESAIPEDTVYPEDAIPRPAAISVRLRTVNAQQGHTPLLYRVGKDYNAVVNVDSASYDEEEGGELDITISGPLSDVQRSIAFLHTTGLSVNPRQRSVTDGGNL